MQRDVGREASLSVFLVARNVNGLKGGFSHLPVSNQIGPTIHLSPRAYRGWRVKLQTQLAKCPPASRMIQVRMCLCDGYYIRGQALLISE
ncbi:hypothetical protein TNCV_3886511 [Trichonephila clavipes]|nr:hypothetical protein TNCV_3886511 [Trichonephila clavipes]